MKKDHKYFIIEIAFGAFLGFFFLHPVSMLINGGWEAFVYCFKDHMHHLIHSPMAWYFTLIGVVLASITAVSRITIRKKNIILVCQKNEIQQKNSVLEQQKEEIEAQAEHLQKANDEIVAQKNLLTKQHENLTASINYAKLIQTAMLATDEFIKSKLPNSFVLFLPKDIVSGDFYWVAEKNNYLFIAAVDCTGHGVPGAFMSLVGNQLLNQIVLEAGINNTDSILNEMNIGIKKFLKHEETNAHAGMDMAICKVDFKNMIVEFSGAGNPMYMINNNELTEIAYNRKHIGGNFGEIELFTKQCININSNSIFYLFSDGYADQFNNEGNRKFGKKNFKELLHSISHLSLEKQKESLLNEHNKWKGVHKQIDDILIIGFKL